MIDGAVVAIVPALDEEDCIAEVVRGIAPHVDHVVVVDNGSRDATARVAREAGADVVAEPGRGYGRACLAGLARARAMGASVVLFLDGDGSDDPADAPGLVAPVRSGEVDIALGVRATIEPGSMTPVQRFGNWLAPALMRVTLGARYSDMPPFKACALTALDRLELSDTGHGFTIEMMVKAHARRLRVVERPVRCRARRGGASKVSGTVWGASRAATKIISTIGRHAVRARVARALDRNES
ncbi:MAG: glycosyltransferase [Thermoleophilia bacterium]|nr:glycosyltransferase [Thermoleophilia bacterium]